MRFTLRKLVSRQSPRPFLRLAGATAVLFCLLILMARAGAQPAAPAFPTLARVYYDDVDDLWRLQDYDVWENNLDERYVLAAVDAAAVATLRAQGWRVVVDENATAVVPTAVAAQPFFNGYRTVDQLYADLRQINAAYPELTELVTYGESYCRQQGGCTTQGGERHPGFDLLALRVTNENVAGASTIGATTVTRGSKPIFFLMANIHAREITTPELAMRFLDWLVAGYGVDPEATWLVDWQEIWIVPTVNPDGHWLVELGTQPPYNGAPFYQRKNANQDADGNGRIDCLRWPPDAGIHYGVDLNRNHSFGWGWAGSSGMPCSVAYRGEAPASEPEVAQLEHLISSLIPDQRGAGLGDAAPADTTGILISLHSYSDLVLWPWGYTADPAPNYDGLKAIGDRLASFNGYRSCQPAACLYGASGTTDEWAYGELGIPAFTFEIGRQFMPPYAEIDAQQWPENAPALRYAAAIARTPYLTVHGPDVVNVQTAVGETAITLRAGVDDRRSGGQAVAEVAYTVDKPIWAAGAAPQPLTAVDGRFDSVAESAVATLPLESLTPGRHTIFVYGRDANGRWGAPGVTFVDVQFKVSGTSYEVFVPLALAD